MNSVAERDISRDIQRRVGEVVERQLEIARHVLEPSELAIVLIQLAVSVNLTAAATIAAMAEDPGGAGEAFDMMLASIATFAKSDRERALAAAIDRVGSRKA